MALRERIADQFSGRSDRADIWRAFDLFLNTEGYLNLGYSVWYQPHGHASSQRRLVSVVGRHLEGALAAPAGASVVDVGAGRGGPAHHLAEAFDFAVTGVDLVAHNVALAAATARRRGFGVDFVVGDATALPVAPASVRGAVAIDALVYLRDRHAALREIATVLEDSGVLVFTDLIAAAGLDDAATRAVAAFADGWDMPPLATARTRERAVEDVGMALERRRDLSANSVGQFRKWTALFLAVVDSPLGGGVERALRAYGLDADAVIDQIRLAHGALPHLRHVLFVVRQPA